MKRILITALLLTVLLAQAIGAAGLDSEILLYPSSDSVSVGETMDIRVVVTVLHGYCPLDLEDTIVQASQNIAVTARTDWQSLGSSRYEQVVTVVGTAPGTGAVRVYRQCPKFGLLEKRIEIAVLEPPAPVIEPQIFASAESLTLEEGSIAEFTVTIQSSEPPSEATASVTFPTCASVLSETPWVQKSATRYQKTFIVSGTGPGSGDIGLELDAPGGSVQHSVPITVAPQAAFAGTELSIMPGELEVGLGETAYVTLVLSDSAGACSTESGLWIIDMPEILEIEAEGEWTYDENTQLHTKQIEISGSMGGSADLSVSHVCPDATLASIVPVTVVPYALNPLTDQEIFVDVSAIDLEIGDTVSFTVAIKVIHSNCPLDIDDTKIVLPDFLSLFSQTPWEQVESNLYEKTVTVRADADGSGYVSVIRDCPRYGLLEKQVPAASGTGELPSGGVPPPDMPVFDWSTMKNLSIGDIAALYGVDVSDLAEMFGADAGMTLHDVKNERGITKYEIQGIIEDAYAQYNGIVYDVPEPQRISYSLLLQDYVYIVLVAAGSILFALKKYKFRLVLLGLSLLYFGFYLKGCMCQLGVFANFFIFDTIELHWFVLLVVPVVSTLLVGRSFCGWVCFFGTIQEYLFEARKRVFPFKTRRKLPSWLSYSKFVVLGLILYFAIVSSRVVFCDYDPFFYIIYRMFSLDTLGVLTVLLVAGSLFIERPFCRYACPMGAVLMAADAVALNRVRVAEPSCNACRLCTRVCPMNRDLVNGKGECINCGKCFETCRKDALYYGKKKRA